MVATPPGRLFVERYGVVESIQGVMRYVAFLRNESNLGTARPIDLGKIYRRFDLPEPELGPLDQQALLLDPEAGLILLKEDDPRVRQRFSEAHELIEMLISALPTGQGWKARQHGIFKPKAKEDICNAAAAELLMPRNAFMPLLHHAGASFETARQLARKFWVSTTASLKRVAELANGCHAVVLWQIANKPSEIKHRVPASQASFLDVPANDLPPKQLRVGWAFKRPLEPIIPTHKSVPEDSAIYRAWQGVTFTSGTDRLDLGPIRGIIRSENYAFAVPEDTLVLSLLHLPGDSGCGRGQS